MSTTVQGIFFDLLEDAGGVALMILQAGESGEGNLLAGKALLEGLRSGYAAKAIEGRWQGGEGMECLIFLVFCSRRHIRAVENGFSGKPILEQGGKAFCPLLVRGCSAGEKKNVGAVEGCDRFPQITTGKNPAVAGQGVGVEQDDVDIPIHGHMLEAIIEEQYIASKGVDGMATGKNPDNAGEHRDSRQGFGHQARLIAGFFGIEEYCGAIRYHVDPIAGGTAIAATDDRRFIALALEKACKKADRRGFAGSPHGQVAHRDDRNLEPVASKEVARVQERAKPHDRAVQRTEGAAKEVEFFGGIRHGTFLHGVDEWGVSSSLWELESLKKGDF